jgi:hypothetical protein
VAALALSGLGEREIIPLAMLGLPMLRSTVSSVRSILRRLRVRISCFLDTRWREERSQYRSISEQPQKEKWRAEAGKGGDRDDEGMKLAKKKRYALGGALAAI